MRELLTGPSLTSQIATSAPAATDARTAAAPMLLHRNEMSATFPDALSTPSKANPGELAHGGTRIVPDLRSAVKCSDELAESAFRDIYFSNKCPVPGATAASPNMYRPPKTTASKQLAASIGNSP